MKKLATLLTIVFITGLSFSAQSHPGLTDKDGCHTENDGTNYHCHEESEPQNIKKSGSDVDKNKTPKVESDKKEDPERVKVVHKYQKVQPVKTFHDERALVTMGLSMGAITLGSMIAGSSKPKHFGAIVLPSIGSGLISSSIFSLQVGLKSKTSAIGFLPVMGSAILPFILAGNFDE